jgi:hypothetical protein
MYILTSKCFNLKFACAFFCDSLNIPKATKEGVMMIRQGFQELPPKMFLMQIMNDLTKAYCFLWEKKDKLNRIWMSWKDLSKYYNKNSFRTNLRKLNNEGLLNYDESDDGVTIELVGWDEVMDED